ncbi:MAG: hypothetical protein K1X75_09130 [Leptospirales bacterium]|nr:hypothetical protein [Leptospirales bacterium]
MNRKSLERTATSIAVFSLGLMSLGSVLAIADGIFKLDILPDTMERFAYLLLGVLFVTIVSSVMVSIMLNVSIMASGVDLASKHLRGVGSNEQP